MNTEDELARLERARKRVIRPLFYVTLAVTLIGNLSQADAHWLSWLTHAWAPIVYVAAVEIVALRIADGGYGAGLNFFLIVLGLLSFAVSYAYLREAAVEAGWTELTSYAFPALVDAFAITLTIAMKGISAKTERISGFLEADARRVRDEERKSAEEVERSKGGRPRSDTSRRAKKELEQAASESRAFALSPGADAAMTEIRTNLEQAVPKHTKASERIVAEFGTDPNAWPSSAEMTEQLGMAKATVSNGRKRAEQVLELASV